MSKVLLSIFKVLGAALLVCVAAIVIARAVFPLPSLSDRIASNALPSSNDTTLGRITSRLSSAHPGMSGVLALSGGRDAIGSRLSLANAAERSIDAQYYIWHDDTTGRLLLKALYDAAARGVRVRLLLDDNGIGGLDPTIATLESQPNIEIRLFNPSTVRSPKLAGYAFDFFRMNRRMHNKTFIVDGAVAIIGGRNIGDEYFDIGERTYFIDLDVLAVGDTVPETSRDFDRYWNSGSAYPSNMIIDPSVGNLRSFLDQVDEVATKPEAKLLADVLATGASRLIKSEPPFEWVSVKLISDDPAKGLGKASQSELMISRLASHLGNVHKSLDLISAYFVPSVEGTEYFTNLAQGGVQVRVLTNAMTSTDVVMVHAGYSKYRRELLEAGIDLYELKPVIGLPQGRRELSVTGSSGTSLHAKTFAIDNKRVFIGSFNFDPRSALLNCEIGYIIESPTMAQTISAGFDAGIPNASYQPVLGADGKMIWIEPDHETGDVTYTSEPGVTIVDRIAISILGWLPIEWLL